ncbi:type I addiction module toxin, SymE family [Pectobacterium polaris]|nr:type I addiction module toxin, SymE family [Pectobacterium polaris]
MSLIVQKIVTGHTLGFNTGQPVIVTVKRSKLVIETELWF